MNLQLTSSEQSIVQQILMNFSYYHVGVYLGNNLVCHYSKEKNGTKIDQWEEFVKDGERWIRDDVYELLVNSPHGLYGYHPVIPFKNFWKIAEQISWSEDVNFRKNEYNLADRNCEHFANMVVYGINYSEQIYDSILKGNNGKGSAINLRNEMNESNGLLSEKNNSLSSQIKARIEVPPKEHCRIM